MCGLNHIQYVITCIYVYTDWRLEINLSPTSFKIISKDVDAEIPL